MGDVNFDCSEKGLQVQSMDSSHVALVSLLLRESAFEDFRCDRPTSLGMNVDSLAKIFKMCGPSDSLKLRWQNDADTLNFQCESGEDDRIADFDLKLMQIESEHMEIPEQHYKVVAKLPSGEFQKICRDLKELGLGPDAPLLVKYDLEKAENGFMQFYLAPKIDE